MCILVHADAPKLGHSKLTVMHSSQQGTDVTASNVPCQQTAIRQTALVLASAETLASPIFCQEFSFVC